MTLTPEAPMTAEQAPTVQAGDDGGPAVVLDEVSKVYGRSVVALDKLSLTVGRGEFVCLVGASGCGKSTLLSIISGLDSATAGSVETFGRHPALMFQESALFPWLTVAANVELALRLRGVGKDERRRKAAELLDVVSLGDVASKRPHELSGGMRQRVALARTLGQDSDVLLMDEPFGALDAMTRDLLHDELERLWAENGLTVLFVTHDVREAVRLGQRVVLLSSRPGRVVQEWTVGDLAAGAQPEMVDTINHKLHEVISSHAGG